MAQLYSKADSELNSELTINSGHPPDLLFECPTFELNSELPTINSRLPPELLTRIFHFLPISDLKNTQLVCRST